MNPAGPAAQTHHVRSLRAAAVDQNDRVRKPLLGGNHVLYEHLSLRDRAVRHRLAANADKEAPLVCKLHAGEFRIAIGVGAWNDGRRSSRSSRRRSLAI